MTTYINTSKLRILSVLMILALMISFCFVGMSTYSADESDSDEIKTYTHGAFEYTVDKEGAHITAFTGNAQDVSIPATIDGHTVVTIGLEAFWYKEFLSAVNIPDTVTCIEAKAFQGCKNLTLVNIPDSVYEIGDAAFNECEKLADIHIPAELLYVGGFAFDGTEWIKQFEGKSSVILAGKHFYKYQGKESVVNIPKGVISISSNAFADNKDVTYVNIPETVQFFGGYSFYGCSNLKSLSIGDDATYIGDCAFGVDHIDKTGQPVLTEGFTLYANDDTRGAEYCDMYGIKRLDSTENPTPDELPEEEEVNSGYTVTPVNTEIKNLGVLITIIVVAAAVVGGLYAYFTIKEKKLKEKEKSKRKQNQNKKKKSKKK